jgi:predicted DNA-binding transcriptional regulator YafY
VNRTDRLYALVEELRAVAPRPRSARWLAERFEVSVRTVPIWAEPGRTGGYALDRNRTLPPLALTPAEALAITVAVRTAQGSPFGGDARSAAQKVRATLPADVRRVEERLAGLVFHTVGADPVPAMDASSPRPSRPAGCST